MIPIRLNGVHTEVREPRLAALLGELGVEPGRAGVALALNGEVVPRSAWETATLAAGDEVDVVGARQGG